MAQPLYPRDSRFVLFGLDEERTSWRGVGLLAVVFFGSLLIAAILTPPAYWLVEWWHNLTGSANAQWLLDKGVDVYFDRLRMLAILLGLPWLMSKCHLWSWKGLGLAFGKKSLLSCGLYGCGGIFLIHVLAHWNNVPTTADWRSPQLLLEALLAGILLGFLEEVIFRGMILRMFYTATRQPWLALVLMSAFFRLHAFQGAHLSVAACCSGRALGHRIFCRVLDHVWHH